MDIKLDCRGLACPQPVIKAKNELEQGADNLVVIVDNEAARDNVSRFASSRNCVADVTTLDDGSFLVNIQSGDLAGKGTFNFSEHSCEVSHKPKSGIVFVISSDSMGRGNDELGWALLQSYIQTIYEVTPLPEKIIFYNGGVKLVSTGSGVIKDLRKLKRQGVTILVCGACLDFYELQSALEVGRISNMYEILSSMSEAKKIISPF
jgi:selenium metabolism protein YedF